MAAFTITTEEVEAILGIPFDQTAHNCHGVSLALVQSGALPKARVARGHAKGVVSQHSWVVLGDDCYNPAARIIDATLWSYDDKVEGVYVGKADKRPHTPHGAGSIWEYGAPPDAVEEPIDLAVYVSATAKSFLALCGPLDLRGWAFLANAPVAGWPAAEIIAAMDDTPELAPHVPIDRLGMLTDRNPNGLYR